MDGWYFSREQEQMLELNHDMRLVSLTSYANICESVTRLQDEAQDGTNAICCLNAGALIYMHIHL
jgi:hypothetical protein